MVHRGGSSCWISSSHNALERDQRSMLQRSHGSRMFVQQVGDFIGAVTDDEFQYDDLLLVFSEPLHCLVKRFAIQMVLRELLHIVAVFAADRIFVERYGIALGAKIVDDQVVRDAEEPCRKRALRYA